ncbi:MAG: A24 family peptidase, partial [Phycisphaerales bacterium]|nr:A24 family peptidase [Phycisphaerales bacterium]
MDEIEAESDHSRSRILKDFAWLLPAVLVGLALLVGFRGTRYIDVDWPTLTDRLAQYGGGTVHGFGMAHALTGLILAAALGWSVRILGTLAFGKEAFGSGDIYILAAIGAVGGLWFTVFTFFLAALLALIGVLATTLLRKQTRAIPFGPWLALGAFVTLWAYER